MCFISVLCALFLCVVFVHLCIINFFKHCSFYANQVMMRMLCLYVRVGGAGKLQRVGGAGDAELQ